MPRTVGQITWSITRWCTSAVTTGAGSSTHAARVRAGVLVADALVVLAGGHGQHVVAVDHDDEAGFFAVEELFDHHARTGFTEGIAGQHVTHGGFGFFEGHGDDDAFARSQAVGLITIGAPFSCR